MAVRMANKGDFDLAKQEAARALAEKKRQEEEDIRRAEEEFLRKHEEQKKLGKEGSTSGHSRTTSVSSLNESESEADSKKRSREEKESSAEKLKKKRMESDEELDTDEFGDDPVINFDLGLDLIARWLRQPTIQKMVSKPQHKKIEGILKRLKSEVICCREERIRLQTKVEERGALVEVVRKTVREELQKEKVMQPGVARSYATAVTANKVAVPKVTGVRGPVQPAPKLVFIRHEKKESPEIISTLKKLVKPSEIGLKVKRLTSIRNGVIVEAESEEGAEALMKQKALEEAGLKVGKPDRKRPIVMIYDVGSDLKDEDILDEVFSRNMNGSEIQEEEFKREFKVRHRYKDKRLPGKKCHIVVECSVRVRNWLRSKERLFIEWQSCRVKDYVDVARCYKCQRYGHIAKHCSGEKMACSYCAGEHTFKDCPKKNNKDRVCCINCKREGRVDDKHDAGWRGCPAYEKAVKRNNEKIDYGL